MEDGVTIGVTEDEMRLSKEILLGLVTLETLTISGEVVEDPAGGLGSQLPGPGGQVDKVFLLGNISTKRKRSVEQVFLQFSLLHCQCTSQY